MPGPGKVLISGHCCPALLLLALLTLLDLEVFAEWWRAKGCSEWSGLLELVLKAGQCVVGTRNGKTGPPAFCSCSDDTPRSATCPLSRACAAQLYGELVIIQSSKTCIIIIIISQQKSSRAVSIKDRDFLLICTKATHRSRMTLQSCTYLSVITSAASGP